jgi:hypothetical protein
MYAMAGEPTVDGHVPFRISEVVMRSFTTRFAVVVLAAIAARPS